MNSNRGHLDGSEGVRSGLRAASIMSAPGRLRYFAAGLSLLAGLMHALVVPSHFEEWWGYGAFFLVVALGQCTYGAALMLRRPPAGWFLALGVMANGAVIILYVLTRTSGIPLVGPGAGQVESVGAIDLLSKGTELLLIGCLVALLWQSRLRLTPADGR